MVVAGRIRDIGQNVLKYSFVTGRSSSPSYFQIFSLIAFLEEAFIINILIILYINYIIINDNNAVINNNNYGRLQEIILLLKILARESISSIFIDHLGTGLEKCSPAL
jgi:hypothetical protein